MKGPVIPVTWFYRRFRSVPSPVVGPPAKPSTTTLRNVNTPRRKNGGAREYRGSAGHRPPPPPEGHPSVTHNPSRLGGTSTGTGSPVPRRRTVPAGPRRTSLTGCRARTGKGRNAGAGMSRARSQGTSGIWPAGRYWLYICIHTSAVSFSRNRTTHWPAVIISKPTRFRPSAMATDQLTTHRVA